MIWVLGMRSFAAEVGDWARDAGLEPAGFLEPSGGPPATAHAHGTAACELGAARDGQAVLGTGDLDRRAAVTRAHAGGVQIRGLVHPRAHVSPSATVHETAVLGPGVVVGAAAVIGAHAMVGRGALLGHHTTLGPFATLGPEANVAGNVVIGEGAYVGMGALVRDHLAIGCWALIAMGAVVVADIAPGIEVRGVPARPLSAECERDPGGR